LYYIFPVLLVVLDGNFALRRGPETVYPSIHILQCMLERTHARTNKCYNERGSRTNYVLAYPTAFLESGLKEAYSFLSVSNRYIWAAR